MFGVGGGQARHARLNGLPRGREASNGVVVVCRLERPQGVDADGVQAPPQRREAGGLFWPRRDGDGTVRQQLAHVPGQRAPPVPQGRGLERVR